LSGEIDLFIEDAYVIKAKNIERESREFKNFDTHTAESITVSPEEFSLAFQDMDWSKQKLVEILGKVISEKIGTVSVSMKITDGNLLYPTLIPQDLLSGLWLLLSQEMASGRKFLRCNECGSIWINLAKQGHRDKMYCSIKCKSRHFRRMHESK